MSALAFNPNTDKETRALLIQGIKDSNKLMVSDIIRTIYETLTIDSINAGGDMENSSKLIDIAFHKQRKAKLDDDIGKVLLAYTKETGLTANRLTVEYIYLEGQELPIGCNVLSKLSLLD